MKERSQAAELQTATPITQASPNLEPREEWYKLWLTSSEAIEIHINNLTHPCSSLEIYDREGNQLKEAVYSPHTSIVLPFFPPGEGYYYIHLTIGPDPDPAHVYQLHIDKYTRLSGTINDSLLVKADQGPYLLGPEDLMIPAGCCVTVEAGAVINVRGPNKITVKDEGALYLTGEENNPITIIGATGDASQHQWDQLVLSPLAETGTLHTIIQYDNDDNGMDFLTPVAPLIAAASSVEEFRETKAEAAYINRANMIPPASRLAYLKTWFQQVSPYRFSFLGDLLPFELYFGIDVTTFADWEMDSTRVNEKRMEAGQINYWDFVNGNFATDLMEAAHLFANKQSSPELRIQRLIDFLSLGQGWRQKHGYFKWYDLLNPFNNEEEEFYQTFEQMASTFWLAHNTSIIYWDKIARDLGLWQKENEFEQQFINSVIIRVHFAADLPITIPGYGNNIPPIGFLGITINVGPFRYPKQYPAPEPEQDVNCGSLSTASYLKFLFETLIKGQTNPVYTWWLPTQADKQLYRMMNEKGVSFDSPPEDWDREFIQPSQKTLEEIQQFYLSV